MSAAAGAPRKGPPPAPSTETTGEALGEAPFGRAELGLYAITVFAWSASWYALKVNAASGVDPAVSTAWRFALASAAMFAWARLAGEPLRHGLARHAGFAGLGVFLFSTNFILFYQASLALVSGLLAVVFSLASVVNLLLGALRGDLAGPRRWFGAALGATGIALLYWPEIADGVHGRLALALCLGGTLSFCIGNQVSQALQRKRVPVLASSAWGMAYGTLWSALVAASLGAPFRFEASAPYVLSLVFLVIVSTLLAFRAYLALVGRVGAARASYATVMFPVFALLLSTRLEGWTWTPLALAGVALALLGNLFVLRGARARR